MTHTPTPWVVDEDPFGDQNYKTMICLPGNVGFMGTEIARVNHNWNDAERGERRISWKEAEDNAAHIVHCVNLHDELVAALEAMTNLAKREYSYLAHKGTPEGAVLDMAGKALAKAKGGAA